MTDRNDLAASADQDLQTLYRTGPRERVPTHLDNIVMRSATRELEKSALFGGISQWRQPTAVGATLALAVVLLFQWNDLPLLQQNPDTLPSPESGFGFEAANSPARMRKIGETATHRFLGENTNTNSVATPGSNDVGVLLQLRQGMSVDRIAHVTGVNRETAKSRLRYATNKLKAALSNPAAGEGRDADVEEIPK